MGKWNKWLPNLLIISVMNVFAQENVSDSVMMKEVLVVAYGKTDKYSYTGSAATLSTDKGLSDLPVNSFEQLLQGLLTGLNIYPISGQPGTALNLRIRGTGSMNASQEPLYVVDGVPVVSGNIAVSAVSGDTKSFNAMNFLNPADIGRITVLKDAAAVSLYGSRAANGVILITTKHGNSGKTCFRFRGDWSIGDWACRNKETLSGEQQHELTYEAFYNEATLYRHLPEGEAETYARQNAVLYAPLLKKESDWEKALFRNHSIRRNYQLCAMGGKEANSFYASLNYTEEDGIARNSDLEGFRAKLNLMRSLTENLILGVNVTLAKQNSRTIPEMARNANPWYMLHYAYKPNYPIYNEDGSWFHDFPGQPTLTNLVEEQGLDKNESDVFRNCMAVNLSYHLGKRWKIKQLLSYDFILNESTLFWSPKSSNGNPSHGAGVKIVQQLHNVYSSTLLNYRALMRKAHRLDIMAGWDADDRTKKYLQGKGTDFPGDYLPELENAAVAALVASGKTTDRLLSFLSRLDYHYEDKYYLTLNYRRDGSSRLGSDKRWGNFWSVGMAWRLNHERFLKKWSGLNEWKIRMSYGVNGNLPITEYGHLGLLKYGANYTDLPGMKFAGFANPHLSWERNYSFNVGMDLLGWKRFSCTFDYYRRTTTHLLQEVPVQMVTGLEKALKNIGEMRNVGLEAAMDVKVGRVKSMQWESGLVLSHNRNKILKLYEGRDIIDGSRIWREGTSYYAFWSREWAGVDPETGEEQWILNTPLPDGRLDRSVTKDGNQAAKVIVGNAEPKLTGGWRNRLHWKGIDISCLFSFSLGGKVMDDLWTYTDSDGYFAFNTIGVKQWERWQKPGDKTDVPRRINRYKYGRHGSSRHLFPTDHLRLKTLNLSWTFPQRWWRACCIQTARIYVTGQNLWTWAAYDDLDPEQPVEGFTTFAFPNMKTWNFGFEIAL